MRMFDVTILIIDGATTKRIDERFDAVDFHDACMNALGAAMRIPGGRVLSITEVKQPPRLVS